MKRIKTVAKNKICLLHCSTNALQNFCHVSQGGILVQLLHASFGK